MIYEIVWTKMLVKIIGGAFPLVGKIYTRSVTDVGRSISTAYLLNSLGSLLGAFCAGFVLIPLLGKELGLKLVIGLQLLITLIIAGILPAKRRQRILQSATLALPAAAGLILCVYYP